VLRIKSQSPSKTTKTLNISPLLNSEPPLKNSWLSPTLVQVTFGSTPVLAQLLLAGIMIPTIVRNHLLTLLMDKPLTLPTDQAQSLDLYPEIPLNLEMSSLRTSVLEKLLESLVLLSTHLTCQEFWVLPMEVSLLTTYPPSLTPVV